MGQAVIAKQHSLDSFSVEKSPLIPTRTEKKSNKTQEFFTYDEVFGHLKDLEFSLDKAREYLELDNSAFEDLLSSGRLTSKVGKDGHDVFPVKDLRKLKKVLESN